MAETIEMPFGGHSCGREEFLLEKGPDAPTGRDTFEEIYAAHCNVTTYDGRPIARCWPGQYAYPATHAADECICRRKG